VTDWAAEIDQIAAEHAAATRGNYAALADIHADIHAREHALVAQAAAAAREAQSREARARDVADAQARADAEAHARDAAARPADKRQETERERLLREYAERARRREDPKVVFPTDWNPDDDEFPMPKSWLE
jgi:regulator of protease activity HflC (stomatin/prohibitin superfamily)